MRACVCDGGILCCFSVVFVLILFGTEVPKEVGGRSIRTQFDVNCSRRSQ